MKFIAVEVYDELIKINLETGEGYDKVILKMEPLINSYSYKFKIENLMPEDIKQEVCVILLEGIANYDHSKNVKLSTFLHTHIFNKMVSKFNASYKKSNNANFLNTGEGNFFNAMYMEDLGENPEDFLEKDSSFQDLYDGDFNFLVQDLKDNLSEIEWGVFDLIFLKGNTIKQTAAKLKLEVWNISSVIKRIKKNESIRRFYK